MARARIGKLKPVYSLLLNPYAEARLSCCPQCNRPTFARKFALMIHVEGWGLYAQGKMCKYCSRCKLILVQQGELEEEIARAVHVHRPTAAGNEYVVVGVVEPKAFKAGLGTNPGTLEDMLERTSDIREQYGMGYSPGGWYRAGQQPVLPAFRAQRVPREM